MKQIYIPVRLVNVCVGLTDKFDKLVEGFTFDVYLFNNGLVLDYEGYLALPFYPDLKDIKFWGNGEISKVLVTEKLTFVPSDYLLERIQGSMLVYGIESVPAKHAELWRKPKSVKPV